MEYLEVSQQEADTKPEHNRCKSEAQRAAVGTVTVQIRHSFGTDSVMMQSRSGFCFPAGR